MLRAFLNPDITVYSPLVMETGLSLRLANLPHTHVRNAYLLTMQPFFTRPREEICPYRDSDSAGFWEKKRWRS